MRLIDLDPRWYVFEAGGPRVGLTFECPHCRSERLGVTFHHRGHEAIEDAYIAAKHPTAHVWTLEGDSFENLTLSPSVDASSSGHWHGFVTNGEIT
jgi:hypothetical protein